MKKGLLIMAFGAFLAGLGNAGENKMVYDAHFSVDGIEYIQHVMASHIAKQPKWNPETDATCPLSAVAAIKAARAEIGKFYPKGIKREVVDLHLFKMEGTEQWCYQILFSPPQPDDKDDLNILVLLDGTVPEVKKAK